ncbi:potassium channel family protein [Halovenus marina]|jgi:trk system potassium uptake protein TrkA|uniref:potassium channel family protein n=1 Tax=Halovenus marina TaxID=3396621 RepID=UPI003F5554B9
MKFVIVGFGRVGMRTARLLQGEGHDVTIVDNDPAKVDRAGKEGFPVVEGDGNEDEILEAAGIDDADAVGGLTGDLSTNLAVCVIGDARGCRTVLRISEDYSDDLYQKYAADVDEIVYPERLGAAGAKTALMGGDFSVIADLAEELSVTSVTVPEGSPVIGQRVIAVELPGNARIYAHGTEREPMSIPLPDVTVKAGDSLAVMVDPDDLSAVRAMLRGEEAPA